MRQLLLTFLCLLALKAGARVFPEEGASLSYRRIPFSVESVRGAAIYLFRIVAGEHKEVQAGVGMEQRSRSPFVIMQADKWEEKFSWQVIYINSKGREIGKSPVRHFRIVDQEYKDVTRYRLRVIKDNYPNEKKLHFFIDNFQSLYNTDGHAVWNLNTMGSKIKYSDISDLKLTPFNTISFLAGESIYETDYFGNVLWSAGPHSGGVAHHHEFTRLKNGNYMSLSSEIQQRTIPGTDSMMPVVFGTIVEYDASGKKVWEWRSAEYFKDADIFGRRTRDGQINSRSVRTHLNAFYHDAQNGVVYAGFKDISRILKISYADKKVLEDLNGKPMSKKTIFSQQHSIGKDKEGNLLVFSNNDGVPGPDGEWFSDSREEDTVSTIVRIREPRSHVSLPEKVWEMSTYIDPAMLAVAKRGGNIVELPDGNLFVCSGAASGIFIVNQQKEILYSAVAELWNDQLKAWQPYPQYRAYPVFLDEVDKLIEASVKRSGK